MNFLFVHNNFPAQFRHVATALARDGRNRVVAIGSMTAREMPGIELHRYDFRQEASPATHSFARRFDIECRRAEQVLYLAAAVLQSGFVPDVIVVHSGWGEALPLRAVFPAARVINYCEYYYRPDGQDVNFDPEFPRLSLDGTAGLAAKNAMGLLALADCDLGLSPTEWQRATHPIEFQGKIKVLHEGVDTDAARPNPGGAVELPSGLHLQQGDEVITFVARNLEPLRGFHAFMRALPRVLALRPRAQVLVIGGDGVSYGAAPPPGTTWKEHYLDEVRAGLDLSRIHFLGLLDHRQFLSALQVSAVHVYLTYPFVLSWSLIEAMSCGCVVVGSDVGPVREAIEDGRNGILVPFFEPVRIASAIIDVLENPARYQSMRAAARATVLERYDLHRHCLPAALSLLTSS
jgi:glycosyltransferase involved in cell wall biosynthesis